jgi:hypothetical protein
MFPDFSFVRSLLSIGTCCIGMKPHTQNLHTVTFLQPGSSNCGQIIEIVNNLMTDGMAFNLHNRYDKICISLTHTIARMNEVAGNNKNYMCWMLGVRSTSRYIRAVSMLIKVIGGGLSIRTLP